MKESIRKLIRERDHYRCWRCGAEEHPEIRATGYVPRIIDHFPGFLFRFDVDHLIPKAHGGTDEVWNLALACQDCNRGRQDTIEFAALALAKHQRKGLRR